MVTTSLKVGVAGAWVATIPATALLVQHNELGKLKTEIGINPRIGEDGSSVELEVDVVAVFETASPTSP
jgi:hypothetical protein